MVSIAHETYFSFDPQLHLLRGSILKIPREAHNLAQLDEVQEKATKAKQPIAFVIAEKKMTAT